MYKFIAIATKDASLSFSYTSHIMPSILLVISLTLQTLTSYIVLDVRSQHKIFLCAVLEFSVNLKPRIYTCSSGTARWKNFISTFCRAYLNHGNRFRQKSVCYFFREVPFLSACGWHAETRLPRSSWTSPGYNNNKQ